MERDKKDQDESKPIGDKIIPLSINIINIDVNNNSYNSINDNSSFFRMLGVSIENSSKNLVNNSGANNNNVENNQYIYNNNDNNMIINLSNNSTGPETNASVNGNIGQGNNGSINNQNSNNLMILEFEITNAFGNFGDRTLNLEVDLRNRSNNQTFIGDVWLNLLSIGINNSPREPLLGLNIPPNNHHTQMIRIPYENWFHEQEEFELIFYFQNQESQIMIERIFNRLN